MGVIKRLTFGYTGALQTWQIPSDWDGVSPIVVTLNGAGGTGAAGGGRGGSVSFHLDSSIATVGQWFYLAVGGAGSAGKGGWGGGATLSGAAPGGSAIGTSPSSGEGGGATSLLTWDGVINDPATALVGIAGAGGGSGGGPRGRGGVGGDGGATTSQVGHAGAGTIHGGRGGGAATQTTNGAAGANGAGVTGTAAGAGTGPFTIGVTHAGGSAADSLSNPFQYGGGSGGGGYRGGGGGGAGGTPYTSYGGGGGAGGVNWVDPALTTTVAHTQGGGAPANNDGSIVISYNRTSPAPPDVTTPNEPLTGQLYVGTPLTIIVASLFTDSSPGTAYQYRYRPIGSSTWTTISATYLAGGYAGIFYLVGGLPAGDYESQGSYTDSASLTSAWSASVLFTILPVPAAAFPYVDLPNQWADATALGQITGADDMNERIGAQLDRLAYWAAHYQDTDPLDSSRQADQGFLYGVGTTQSVTAGTPVVFDTYITEGSAFVIMDRTTGIVKIIQGGLYMIGFGVRNAGTSNPTHAVRVLGCPSPFGHPGCVVQGPGTSNGGGGMLSGYPVRFAGGETIWLQPDNDVSYLGAQSDPDGDTVMATYFYGWRVGE